MFTGIIETLGKVITIEKEKSNIHLTIQSSITDELKIDQSVAHNGVCLTVVSITKDQYIVTAINETLEKSNLNDLKEGDYVNIERAMVSNARLDGHMVQGHVDTTGKCIGVSEENGSWVYSFEYPLDKTKGHIVVDKGSVCVNGTSLTVINPTENVFSVAIIPYTHENTVFKFIKPETRINLEFDIIGKYVSKYIQAYL